METAKKKVSFDSPKKETEKSDEKPAVISATEILKAIGTKATEMVKKAGSTNPQITHN